MLTQVNLRNDLAAAKLQQTTLNTQVSSLQEQNHELEKQLGKITTEAKKIRGQFEQVKNSESGTASVGLLGTLLSL